PGRRAQRPPRRPTDTRGRAMTGLASLWSTERVDGVLAPFAEAGLVGPFEIQLAAAAGRAAPDASDDELLALALVARPTRLGHVCLDLDQVRRQVAASQDDEGTAVELPLPDVGSWSRTLASGPLVAAPDRAHDDPLRPLVWDGGRLYLQRYWSFELAVAEQIIVRSASAPDGVDGLRPSHVDAALEAVFPAEAPDEPGLQRLAGLRALIHPVTVMAGGPGT